MVSIFIHSPPAIFLRRGKCSSSSRSHDIRPLTHLTNLKTLWIDENPITDYHLINALSVIELARDEVCDLADGLTRPGIQQRIENRKYPSVFQAWDSVSNRPSLSYEAAVGLHGLYWLCCYPFGLHWRQTDQGVRLVGNVKNARAERDALLAVSGASH